ncbi:MAG: DUF3108 domain-containing protein [Verrucomicrobiae bacterium]|nr:DUF3108 domain-containing protein [Verrucomicrobiae bacterium]
MAIFRAALPIWALFLFALGAHAQPPQPFHPGEILTYHVRFGFIMAGRCWFEVQRDKQGRDVFTVTGQSNDFISTFYPTKDIATSYCDPERQCSVRFFQDRREGKRHCWEDTFFYYSFGKGSTQSYTTGEIKWFDIPPGRQLQDKLSVIYHMRRQDWKTSVSHAAVIGNDKGCFEMEASKTDAGTITLDDFAPIPAFKAEPSSTYLSGFLKKAKVHVWVSDDDFKVPLRIAIKAVFGTLTVELVKVENIPGWPYQKDGRLKFHPHISSKS